MNINSNVLNSENSTTNDILNNNFLKVISKYRELSISRADLGGRFEKLIRNFLKTYQIYKNIIKDVYLWTDFDYKTQFNMLGNDIGIDLVAETFSGEYWAIQCKCYQEDSSIDKKGLDSFISASNKFFYDNDRNKIYFSNRLFISTSSNISRNVYEITTNQNIPIQIITLDDLESAQIDWEKLDNGLFGGKAEVVKKSPKKHQEEAIEKVHEYFKKEDNDRGKLIMACGTGKTFTSLKIAENETNNKGLILFLVPSIGLVNQTLKEWSSQATNGINAICVCSDNKVGIDKSDEDEFPEELSLPATTDPDNIVKQFKNIEIRKKYDKNDKLTVVFSTYQSIEMVKKAQDKLFKIDSKKYIFDLIICDEAHRTTGVVLKEDKKDNIESGFTRVHNSNFIKAKKRLYMTATPRLYTDDAKQRARDNEYIDTLCSMDDEEMYGKEIYRLGFGRAVEMGLLSDYRVICLVSNEDEMAQNISNDMNIDLENINEQNKAYSTKNSVNAEDVAKLLSCIKGLSKILVDNEAIQNDSSPMKTALAFCQTIKNSKNITALFSVLSEKLTSYVKEEKNRIKNSDMSKEEKETQYQSLKEYERYIKVEADHIDGTMNAFTRDQKLRWLKSDKTKNTCRMLTNVRCLSEGIDVPSMDAILFLSSRSSQVDVVQSVGRVMRKSIGKKYGYIIIPVVVPYGEDPSDYINKSDKFKTVWEVLNALRAHDERFDAEVNKISFNKNSNMIIIDGGNGKHHKDNNDNKKKLEDNIKKNIQLQFDIKFSNIFYAKLVDKVGTKKYIEQWAKDVAEIAKININKIKNILKNNNEIKKEFNIFLNEIKQDINDSITENDVIEMLSQHLITQPIFDALFNKHNFSKHNPISKSMVRIVGLIKDNISTDENEKLERFYNSIKTRVSGINSAEDRQSIIKDLYNDFFNIAFKSVSEKLGIVYTPIEVIDFIIHSVNYILKKEFGKSLADKGINIIDPFTGTGTFITRLLQSGLIGKDDLPYKYRNEIFANEIVLLAYYIASINIENVYQGIMGDGEEQINFEGICLTDTFNLYEDMMRKDEQKTSVLGEEVDNKMLKMHNLSLTKENGERIKRQQEADINVVISNPPYSIRQKSANDDNQNQHYPLLEKKIQDTYVKYSIKQNVGSNLDSYVKAIRWATDKIKGNGVVGFITNNGWLDSNSADGLRKCLNEDYTDIYIIDLKGNIRKFNKSEGENIFNVMVGCAIYFLVKNKDKKEHNIYYYNVGDNLKKKEKLDALVNFKNIESLEKENLFIKIISNKHYEWLNQRGEIFNKSNFIPINPNNKYDIDSKSWFITYSLGLGTNRDTWCYNFSKERLEKNIKTTINYYNDQRKKINKRIQKEPIKDDKKCNWTADWNKYLNRDEVIKEDENSYTISTYRPFCKQNVYFNRNLNERVCQLPNIFPNGDEKNLCINVTNISSQNFSCYVAYLDDLNTIGPGSQNFPLHYYIQNGDGLEKYDNITDFILQKAKEKYSNKSIVKEDLFYYVYGILHSEEYRTKFKNDLFRTLARIPLVNSYNDFSKLSDIGKRLADLHINYENVKLKNRGVKLVINGTEYNNNGDIAKNIDKKLGEDELYDLYRINKMKFTNEKTAIVYNSNIRIENIPNEVYNYILNGKSAIDWIVDRYAINVDKKSGIVNDPNDWCRENNNPKYIFDLLLSIIEVSLETIEILKEIPSIEFEKLD